MRTSWTSKALAQYRLATLAGMLGTLGMASLAVHAQTIIALPAQALSLSLSQLAREGAVNILAPSELTANQALRTDGTTMVAVDGPQAVNAMLSWKDQRLDFDNTSIVDVIGDLQRYRSKPIVLADNKAGKFRVSGGFSIADPEQLLKTLPSVAPVTVTMKPDGTAVIASRH